MARYHHLRYQRYRLRLFGGERVEHLLPPELRAYGCKIAGSTRTRGWIVRERDTEEVNANRNIEART